MKFQMVIVRNNVEYISDYDANNDQAAIGQYDFWMLDCLEFEGAPGHTFRLDRINEDGTRSTIKSDTQ